MTTPRLGLDSISAQGRHFLLAVSGGRDSMCMLHLFVDALHQDSRLAGASISVASVHHGLRGAEADADLRLVQETCMNLNVPFYPIHLDFQELQGSGGFEVRARDARYRELQKLRQNISADYLCTAHHQQDQVETILLRMTRGTGLWGLRGILPLREDQVFRPLLHVSFTELADYAKSAGIVWRTDATNADAKYARNRMRHLILPHLRAELEGLDSRLLHLSDLARSVCQKISLISQTKLESLAADAEIRRLWLAAHGSVLDHRKLVIHSTPQAAPTLIGGPITILNRPNGTKSWGANMYLFDWKFRVSPGQGEKPDPASGIIWIDVTFCNGAIALRARQDGDLFTPPGLRCTHRKLKKYMQEVRVPRHERDSIPLVAFGNEVLWVAGHAVSGNHQVHSQSTTVLELRLTRCHKKTP